jgi:aspartyl-tRNA(Asn)/glutamyl-tRNA(Gln) amidotransferase subunit C
VLVVSEKDVEHIAELADVGIHADELPGFTRQFNEILKYFDILDRAAEAGDKECGAFNVMREDDVIPSLPQEEVLRLSEGAEEGFVKAPRVM